MLFNQDFNALVIATKVTVAKNLVEKVRVMHDLLPIWLRDGGSSSVEDNKLSLKLKNAGYNVITSHIENCQDFFQYYPENYDIIITNPPYSLKS